MVERGSGAGLALEILGLMDHTHAAAAKLLQHAIVRDRTPDQGFPRGWPC
jgi:hypothetical protein